MDATFSNPIHIGTGHRAIVLATLTDVGAYLIQDWPLRQRGRRAYRTAVAATCRALAGRIEAETARQVFLEALEDLCGPKASASNGEGAGGRPRAG